MLSVVIPVFNEEAAISETILEIEGTLEESDINEFEIVIVNDGSTDNSGNVIKKNRRVRLINLPVNHGYGFALKCGINAAKFDVIAIIDADGTYPVDQIPMLVSKFKQGFDLVVGQRSGDAYRETFVKVILRRVLRLFVEFAAGRSVPDPNSGLRVFSKKGIAPVLPDLCNRFSFTTSQVIISSICEMNIAFVPINYGTRIGRTKVKLLSDSFTTLFYIIQSINRYNPLKIFMLLFMLIFAMGAVLILVGLYVTKTTIIVLGVGSTVSSIIVLSLGLLADALKSVRN